jgi:hypothetical protein
LGFIVDLLSHATIIGFMGGAATVVILQQLKGMLGLERFTTATDIISVMESVFSQTHQVPHTCIFTYIYLSIYLQIFVLLLHARSSGPIDPNKQFKHAHASARMDHAYTCVVRWRRQHKPLDLELCS